MRFFAKRKKYCKHRFFDKNMHVTELAETSVAYAGAVKCGKGLICGRYSTLRSHAEFVM